MDKSNNYIENSPKSNKINPPIALVNHIGEPEVSEDYLKYIMDALGVTQNALAVLMNMSSPSIAKFLNDGDKAYAVKGRRKALIAISEAVYSIWNNVDDVALLAIPEPIRKRVQLIKSLHSAVNDNKYYVAKGVECPDPSYLNSYGVFKHQAFLFDLI